MGSSIQCQICGEPATVHLTQIVNNQIHKVDLCEKCAKEKGVTDPEGFSLGDILGKSLMPGPAPATEGMRCENCGWTPEDFRENGVFGCPSCYEAFRSLINPALTNMHRGGRHAGKIPVRSRKRLLKSRKLSTLRHELETAVAEERYEDAARIRDEIRSFEELSAVNTED